MIRYPLSKVVFFFLRAEETMATCIENRKQLLLITCIISVLIFYAITYVYKTTSSEDLIINCQNVTVFTTLPIGNLGNQIWEYMSLFATTSMYKLYEKYTPCIHEDMDRNLKTIFESVSIPCMKDLPYCLKVKFTKTISRSKQMPTMDNLPENRNLKLEDYSARYEDIIKFGVDNIRKELRFKKDLVTYAQNTLLDVKSYLNVTTKEVTFVGMHYRGGDYVNHLYKYHGNLFKGPPDYKYYMKAMNYFETTYRNVVFILVSADKNWLERNVVAFMQKNYSVVVNPTSGEREKDLVLLSYCNHTIISYGTFGTTAAFLNKGTTFVYDLKLPLDYRGQTIALGIAKLLSNWYIGT